MTRVMDDIEQTQFLQCKRTSNFPRSAAWDKQVTANPLASCLRRHFYVASGFGTQFQVALAAASHCCIQPPTPQLIAERPCF